MQPVSKYARSSWCNQHLRQTINRQINGRGKKLEASHRRGLVKNPPVYNVVDIDEGPDPVTRYYVYKYARTAVASN